MAQEIERKFLVGEIPPGLAFDSEDEIDQGYLVTGETEVRLRRRGDRFLLTVKRGHGLARDEVEVPLDRESFEALWPLTEGHRVEKTRRTTAARRTARSRSTPIPAALEGLVTAEIEFADSASAEAFEPPDWLVRELTGNERYSNQRLALDGLPEEPR